MTDLPVVSVAIVNVTRLPFAFLFLFHMSALFQIMAFVSVTLDQGINRTSNR